MKKLLFLLLLMTTTAFAGEDVTVSWTPPSDLSTLPYDGYFIYYTDSTGSGHKIAIDDKDATEHIVPDVEFGPSQWLMTSRCNSCQVKESDHSNTVDFVVEFKGTPSPPTINQVVIHNAPSAAVTRFRAKVAGIKYRGDCAVKRKGKKIKCSGLAVN